MDNLKVKSFIQAAPFESRLVNTFFLKLGDGPVEMLYRINPLLFAKKNGLDEKKIINIFILAAFTGIFNLFWNLVCPVCGLILSRDTTLHSLNRGSHFCALCHKNVPVILDHDVEVVFQFYPDIYKITIHPFGNLESFVRTFFSDIYKNFNDITHLIKGTIHDFLFLSPEETKTLKINAEPGMLFRLIVINLNISFFIYIKNQAGHNDVLKVTVNDKGFSQTEVHMNSGKLKVEIKNNSTQNVGMSIIKSDIKMIRGLEQNSAQFKSFLNGKMLLNNTTFRNFYKIKNIPGNLNLNIQSLTILFADLHSSTNLNNRTGDTDAYALNQKQFSIFEEIVDQYNGAIIKAMADIIMVSFSKPLDGFLTSLSMLNRIKSGENMNKASSCINLGLHEGHALLINRDGQLDYFGKTVTIAARLQGLAGPDEFFFSDTIFQHKEIKNILKKQKKKIKLYKKNTKLKGVGEKMIIYKIIYVD